MNEPRLPPPEIKTSTWAILGGVAGATIVRLGPGGVLVAALLLAVAAALAIQAKTRRHGLGLLLACGVGALVAGGIMLVMQAPLASAWLTLAVALGLVLVSFFRPKPDQPRDPAPESLQTRRSSPKGVGLLLLKLIGPVVFVPVVLSILWIGFGVSATGNVGGGVVMLCLGLLAVWGLVKRGHGGCAVLILLLLGMMLLLFSICGGGQHI